MKFQRVSNNAHVWYEWHLPQHGHSYNVGGVSFQMKTMTSSRLGVKVKTTVKMNSKCGPGSGQGLFASVAMTTGQEVARREKSRNVTITIEKRISWGGFIIDGTDFIFDIEDESHSRQLWSYIQHSPNPNVKVTIQEDGAVVWVQEDGWMIMMVMHEQLRGG